jgi:hypothetical protein
VHGAEHFGVSTERFALTSTVFVLAIAFTPLVLAPLSEVVSEIGEAALISVWTKPYLSSNVHPVCPQTCISNRSGALLFLPQALSSNFGGLLAARWFVSSRIRGYKLIEARDGVQRRKLDGRRDNCGLVCSRSCRPPPLKARHKIEVSQ